MVQCRGGVVEGQGTGGVSGGHDTEQSGGQSTVGHGIVGHGHNTRGVKTEDKISTLLSLEQVTSHEINL